MESPDFRLRLTDDAVVEIKQRLWNGERHIDVAALFKVSPTSISRIAHGSQRYNTPWPDGSLGRMPIQRAIKLMQRAYVEQPSPALKELTAAAMSADSVIVEGEEDDSAEHAEEARQARQARIQSMASDAKQDMDASFEEAILSTDDTPREGASPEAGPLKYTKMEWDEILQVAPRNPLVKYADEYEPFREAVCIVFKSLPQTDWGMKTAARLCKMTSETLGSPIEKMFKMKDGEI